MTDKETSLLYQNMRSMISLIDKLRDFHLNDYISLPRIAVLGEQSSGKSSLLESICGLNFLPRGSGIVTRRPLELRMIRAPISEPYFIFPKDKGETKFSNPADVTRTIEELTNQIAGSKKNISDVPITCVVYSAEVPDLTLIDLPGMTKNPIDDQPENIDEILKNLIKQYCDNVDTLILCVIPAHTDLANSDALKFARQLDPKGERTIGVLTKIDLMDEGTNAKDILMNNEIKLKYGYVGIKGRSQADILKKMTVAEAIQREIDFFGKHPIYSTLPTEVLGTRSLVDRISNLLYSMIEKSLPRIKKEINERMKNAKDGLLRLGEDFPETEEKKLELVFKLVREFKDDYTQGLNGKYYYKKGDVVQKKDEETMIYKLNSLFSELYEEFSKKDFKVTSVYTDEFIRNAINTYQNVSIPGFHSFDSFLYLIHPQIDKLKEPILHLLEESKLILEEKGVEIIDRVFKKFITLHHEVKETFLKELSIRKNEVKKILENLIKCEDNYLFTNDPSFLLPQQKLEKNQACDLLVLELRLKIDAYFYIIVRNLRDIVPKIIGQFLVKLFNKSIEMKILNSLNKQDYCITSLDENKNTASQRKKLKDELNSLLKAESLLINDFNMGFHVELDQVAKQKDHKLNEINFDEDDIEVEEYLQNLEKINEEFLDFNHSVINQSHFSKKSRSMTPNKQQRVPQPSTFFQKEINQNQQQDLMKNKQHHQPYTQQPSTLQQNSMNHNMNQQNQQNTNVQQKQTQQPNNQSNVNQKIIQNNQTQQPYSQINQQQTNQQQKQFNDLNKPKDQKSGLDVDFLNMNKSQQTQQVNPILDKNKFQTNQPQTQQQNSQQQQTQQPKRDMGKTGNLFGNL